jgi:DNA repair exonuclease SbcCD ATPase subunit
MSKRKVDQSRAEEAERMKQHRTEQLNQIEAIIQVFEERLRKCYEYNRQLALLESVSLGLYDELDKLSKKAPAETITDLALAQVNDVIRETKQLVQSDSYIQRLNEFVPAGDNPQYRDVVIVLRQIRQGLERFKKESDPLKSALNAKLRDAKSIRIALRFYLQGYEEEEVSVSMLKEYDVKLSSSWTTWDYGNQAFAFSKLDEVRLPDYFKGPTNISSDFNNLDGIDISKLLDNL